MPWMTGQQYLDANPDVKAAGVDPLYHVLTYVLHGHKELQFMANAKDKETRT